jgi:serine/threonine-protein kinase
MTVYNGRYELVSQVARGGTAQVYRARDLLLDRPVALKVLFPELSTDHAFVERFRREAQAAANLSHPNIVPVFDWGQSESTYFIVMEYVDGEALSSIIRTQAPLDQHQAASIGADIARALSYAHRHGVVHRDVKPGNVLITSDGQVKVTDFGIARAIGKDEQITQTGLVMGTATYFSPEQAQGLDVDGRSDIYALGVVLYEMLTGRPPFSGDTPVSIAYQHVKETPATPRSFNPTISASLEAVVLQAMAKLPAERYTTAEDLRADLDRYQRGQTVLARPPSEFNAGPQTEAMAPTLATRVTGLTTATDIVEEQPRERPRRTTPMWVAAAIVLIAAIVVGVIFGGRALGYFGGAKYLQVPKVIGMNGSDAITQLKADGLHVSTKSVAAQSAAQAHTVVKQDPNFPNTVRQGGTVTLTITTGPPQKAIPGVLGETDAAATARLQTAGFKVTAVNVPVSPTNSTVGIVVRQNPKAGQKRDPNSTVTIGVVGLTQVVVPPTLASTPTAPVTLPQAGAILGSLGLKPAPTTQTKVSATVPVNDVITSIPPPGTKVPAEDTITLVISAGPGLTVPDVSNETLQTAESNLVAAGFTIGNVTQVPTGDQTKVGLVQKTQPRQSTGGQLPNTPINIWEYTATAGSTGTTSTTVPTGTTGTVGTTGSTGTGTTVATTPLPPPP